ncbi:MAG: hypothetical protein R3D71_03615 [Rickettsiales bacterium]
MIRKIYYIITLFFMFLICQPSYSQVKINVDNDKNDEQESVRIESLFFTADEIKAIKNARKFYEKNRETGGGKELSEDDFLESLEKISSLKGDSGSAVFTYPQFYLSSIAYYTPNKWVLWLNGRKFTKGVKSEIADIEIVSINKDAVTIDWYPKRMDKVVDVQDFTKDNPVRVDMLNNVVTFTLRPNQTFSSYSMQVIEGRVQPITIDLREDLSPEIVGNTTP